MLAKQTWRLISTPDSLCAHVLKAKYYPNCNLLKAGPKKGSSFTWQSIVTGLNTFRRGHIWRVGTGEMINIWEDHCISGNQLARFLPQRGDEPIDPNTCNWDENLIRDSFYQIDRILRIPLSDHMDELFVAWHCTKSYTFSVRSTYYVEYGIIPTGTDLPVLMAKALQHGTQIGKFLGSCRHRVKWNFCMESFAWYSSRVIAPC